MTLTFGPGGATALMQGTHAFTTGCYSQSDLPDSITINLVANANGDYVGTYRDEYDNGGPSFTQIDLTLTPVSVPGGNPFYAASISLSFEDPNFRGTAQGTATLTTP